MTKEKRYYYRDGKIYDTPRLKAFVVKKVKGDREFSEHVQSTPPAIYDPMPDGYFLHVLTGNGYAYRGHGQRDRGTRAVYRQDQNFPEVFVLVSSRVGRWRGPQGTVIDFGDGTVTRTDGETTPVENVLSKSIDDQILNLEGWLPLPPKAPEKVDEPNTVEDEEHEAPIQHEVMASSSGVLHHTIGDLRNQEPDTYPENPRDVRRRLEREREMLYLTTGDPKYRSEGAYQAGWGK